MPRGAAPQAGKWICPDKPSTPDVGAWQHWAPQLGSPRPRGQEVWPPSRQVSASTSLFSRGLQPPTPCTS